MDHSFTLSHLPIRFSDHVALAPLRLRETAPEPREVVNLLLSAGADPTDVETSLARATQESDLTARLVEKLGISFFHHWSPDYPVKLRGTDDAPWTLYFKGTIPRTVKTLAIVGTRKPNDYGIEVLASTLPYLNVRPLQVVSGLAYGIDSLAHFYSCEARIPNFAVLGCGLDMIYPQNHIDLASRIVDEGGGILSEFAPGTQPLRQNFPRRNRIISGLADVVWVVQGAIKSGSYHTAKHALDQSRSVAVTPGDIFSELSQLPLKLLFDGAFPILKPADLDLLLGG